MYRLSLYGYIALVDLGHFFSFFIRTQSVGLLGRGISPSQGRYLHTEQNNRIHALSGIRTHDPIFERARTALPLWLATDEIWINTSTPSQQKR
jgi:hypothetical protein